MSLPAPFDRLRLPLIGSPLFIVSGPELVIAQCKAGIIGSFPALNARPQSLLDEWLHQSTEELAKHNREHPDTPAAPFAVTATTQVIDDDLSATPGEFQCMGAAQSCTRACYHHDPVVKPNFVRHLKFLHYSCVSSNWRYYALHQRSGTGQNFSFQMTIFITPDSHRRGMPGGMVAEMSKSHSYRVTLI